MCPSQMFGTSTMIPPSIFWPIPIMHYYRSTMPSLGSNFPSDDNKENNGDDNLPHIPIFFFLNPANSYFLKLKMYVSYAILGENVYGIYEFFIFTELVNLISDFS